MRLAGTAARLPRYLKLGRALLQESEIPAKRKIALAAGIGYAVLPFDLLPGIIPIVGQLDDLAALLLGLRSTLRACPDSIAQRHLQAASVTSEMLDADLRTIGVAGLWIGRTTVLGARGMIQGMIRAVTSLRERRA